MTHSNSRAISPDDLEAVLLEAALELDQRKDPADHVRARAIRAFGIKGLQFMVEEVTARREGVKLSDIVRGIAEVCGNILSSLNSTTMGGPDGPAPKSAEVHGFALIMLMAIHASMHDEADVLASMQKIMGVTSPQAGIDLIDKLMAEARR